MNKEERYLLVEDSREGFFSIQQQIWSNIWYTEYKKCSTI